LWKGALLLKKYPKITTLHASTYTSALPASILAFLFKKKNILTVHEIFGKLRTSFKPRYSRWIYQRFERLSFMGKHHIYHCVSLYTLNSLRIRYGLPDNKLHLVYNGVEEEFWTMKHVSSQAITQRKTTYGREGKYLMLYYGHSGVSKGIDYLIDALPEIIQKNPDSILIFNLIPAKRGEEIHHRIMQQAKKS
jgi:glycosyltransferase involved in cell wall biosynthesis